MPSLINEGNVAGEFGESTLAELGELRKALDIGYQMPATGVGDDALRVESLEGTLKVLSYNTTHLKLWNTIDKKDAFSTVEEYNLLLQYGDNADAFVASGQLPNAEDTTYQRANQLVKYVGTTRAVNHPATLIRTVPPDIIAQETENGALWLLGKIEQSLFLSNAATNPLAWNGFGTQIEQGGGLVYDLRGNPMDKDDFESIADTLINNFGVPTRVYSNSRVFTDFGKTFVGQQRWTAPGAPTGMAGTPVNGYKTQVGDLEFMPDVFVKAGGPPPTSATSPYAPTAPTVSVAVNAPTVTGSMFGTADAGNYAYQITAVNNNGESAPCTLTSDNDILAGGAATLTITDGGGTYPATGYKIYRQDLDNTTAGPLFINYAIARSSSSSGYGATTTWQDLNLYLPGTFIALVLDVRPVSLTFKQLSPMIKMPLAQIAPSIRWMQLLYGTPIVFGPKFNCLVRNIGKAS
jgi:hypothetical protein